MKKYIYVCVLIMTCFSWSANVHASQTGVGFHVGYVTSELMGGGFYAGAQVKHDLSPAFGFEVAASYRDETSDDDLHVKGVRTKASTLARSFPITGSLVFTLFAERQIPLTLTGGIGVYFYSLTFRPENGSEKKEFDTRFGYHLGFGTDIPVSLGVRFQVGIKYVFLDLENEYGDIVLSEAETNAFMINAGLSSTFDFLD